MTQQQLIEALEPLVDATDLSQVLLALARVCNEKAEHLATNWQDIYAAKQWDKAALRIDRVAMSAPVLTVSDTVAMASV